MRENIYPVIVFAHAGVRHMALDAHSSERLRSWLRSRHYQPENVNERRDRFPRDVPLCQAVRENNREMIYFLLASGARVNDRDHQGAYPLHLACSNDNIEVMAELCAKGAMVSQADVYGNAPLWVASERGFLRGLEWLREHVRNFLQSCFFSPLNI